MRGATTQNANGELKTILTARHNCEERNLVWSEMSQQFRTRVDNADFVLPSIEKIKTLKKIIKIPDFNHFDLTNYLLCPKLNQDSKSNTRPGAGPDVSFHACTTRGRRHRLTVEERRSRAPSKAIPSSMSAKTTRQSTLHLKSVL